jgi:hypothetical protein
MINFDRQGTLKMKKPQVISAQAQKRRGPMRYMLSASLAKVTVWERRKQAATEALGVGVVSLIFEEVGE